MRGVEATIARTGVQVYHDHLGNEIHEYRPDSEVFDQGSMDSMRWVVVTDDHPPAFVDASNRTEYERGTVTKDVRRDGDHLVATLLITDAELIEKMKRGKRDISMGYQCELEMKDGVSPKGEKFHAIQRNIKGNHAAIVDRGRAGTARARMDGLAYQIPQSELAHPTDGQQRADAKHRSDLMDELAKALKEAAEQKVRADAAEKKATEAEAARADLATKLAAAQNEARDQKARADEAVAANAKIKTDAQTVNAEAVKARVGLVSKAIAVLGADAKIKSDDGKEVEILDAADLGIMRAVVVKVDGEDVDVAMRSDASYVRAMFDGACKRAGKSAEAAGGVRQTINQNRQQAQSKVDDVDEKALREKLMQESRDAHKAPMTNKEGA